MRLELNFPCWQSTGAEESLMVRENEVRAKYWLKFSKETGPVALQTLIGP